MDKIEIGAFEAQGLSGVSMAHGADAMGIRMAFPHYSVGMFDDKDILMTLERMGPHAADMSYVTFAWRVPITRNGMREFAGKPRLTTNSPVVYDFKDGDAARVAIEWYQTECGVVIGRYVSDLPVRGMLVANGCCAAAVVEAALASGCRMRQDQTTCALRIVGKVGQPRCVDTRLHIEHLAFGIEDVPAGTAMAVYPVELGPDCPLHFSIAMNQEAPEPDVSAIDAELRRGADKLKRTHMRSKGLCAGSAEAVSALAGYSRCYDPLRKRIQTTVNRTWTGPNRPGPVFGWDNFFTSYAAAWDDPALAAQSLEHIVQVYGEKGIANGPTQRNLIIPVLYRKTIELIGDQKLTMRTWPTMMAFMRFWFADRGDGLAWRDGNGDGLLEAGASRDPLSTPPGVFIQDAMDETGYDEIPIYSDGFTDGRRAMLADGVEFDRRSNCLTLTLVCQNSLYITSCKAMATLADALGEAVDAAWLRGEGARVAALMREKLFHVGEGIFMDRFWSGGFSSVKAMTIFFPLLAGVADDSVTSRLRSILLDPKQFWGDNLVPTVSRSDPSYCDGVDHTGNYWRGNCWPPTTYMVWMAAKEAGWDDVSALIAEKVNQQFMRYWRRHGHAYENYPAEGKVDHTALYPSCWGGRELRYAWAAMLPLCALEEIVGPEPTAPGLRFGNPRLRRQSEWKNFKLAGRTAKAVAGPELTVLDDGGCVQFEARPGVAVRDFVSSEDGVSFLLRDAAPGTEILLRHACLANPAVTYVEISDPSVKATVRSGQARLHLPRAADGVKISFRRGVK